MRIPEWMFLLPIAILAWTYGIANGIKMLAEWIKERDEDA